MLHYVLIGALLVDLLLLLLLLLGPTKQGIITEVSAVVLCMVVDVSDFLSGPILCPQSTVPHENTDRK